MATNDAPADNSGDPTDASITYRLAMGWALILSMAGVAVAEAAARALATAWRAVR